MKTFFTADLHLGHEGVLGMSSRPFEDIEKHDDHLIDQINATVGRDDRLFILGDVAWRACQGYLARLTCRNLHLIYGNHDKLGYAKSFKTAEEVAEITLNRCIRPGDIESGVELIKVWLSHYPHAYWPASHYGSLHLYGHLHSEREETLDFLFAHRRSMDVGVDNAKKLLGEYKPFSEDFIMDRLLARQNHDPVEWYRERQAKRGGTPRHTAAEALAHKLARQFHDNGHFDTGR